MAAKLSKSIKEPSILVKPVSRFGGLDSIHITLMVLVAILILIVVAISYNTQVPVTNSTTSAQQCTAGQCSAPIHNATQVKRYAERVLAGYVGLNSSIALLPYLSNVSAMKVSYLAASKEWYATVPYTSPTSNSTYAITMAIYDSNLTLAGTLFQGVGPSSIPQNYVIAPGVVKLAGKTSCSANGPLQQEWFMDPYAPGGISSILEAEALQQKYAGKLNVSIREIFTQYSTAVADQYGLNGTLNLERYIICGSAQDNFTGFMRSLNASYSGTYVPLSVLQGIAQQSGFNMTSLDSCIASSPRLIDGQFATARYYNITSAPSVLTDCQYVSLPQTAMNAVCYARGSLC
jgi:hypothetical protein